jgi:hypothetical protein
MRLGIDVAGLNSPNSQHSALIGVGIDMYGDICGCDGCGVFWEHRDLLKSIRGLGLPQTTD